MSGPVGIPGSTGGGVQIPQSPLGELLTRLTALENPAKLNVQNELVMPNKAAGLLERLGLTTALVDNKGYWVSAEHVYVPKIRGNWLVGAYFVNTVAAVPAGKFVDIGVGINGTAVDSGATRLLSSIAGIGVQGGMAAQVGLNGSTDKLEALGNSTEAGMKGIVTLWAVFIGN